MKHAGLLIGISCAVGLVSVDSKVFAQTATQAAQHPESQWSTIQTYCFGCHNEFVKAGNLFLNQLSADSVPEHPEIFEKAYQGQAPWDISEPQPEFVRLAEAGAIGAMVLDVGCGTGENALYLAARGHDVWGIDFVPKAIELARDKASQRGLGVQFAQLFERGLSLLRLIPGLSVRTTHDSCSGMAGTFGLKAENYDLSLAAGAPMLAELAQPGVHFGATECSSCRMQMEDGGRKRTLHPVQYLALAYGLMPELTNRLEEPVGDLVL